MERLQKVRQMRRDFEQFLRERPKLPQLAPAIFAEDVPTDISGNEPTDNLPFDEFYVIYPQTDTCTTLTLFRPTTRLIYHRAPRSRSFYPVAKLDCETSIFDMVATIDWEALFDSGLSPDWLMQGLNIGLLNAVRIAQATSAPANSDVVRKSIARTIKSRSGNTRTEMSEFITIRPKTSSASRGDGTGSPRCPHERRGHYRQLRSGKRIWINQMSIKGGSIVPRNFRLMGQG